MSSRKISGFPEWLPEQRLVETHIVDQIRRVFELNGFIGIETRAVETLADLESKGETSKEVYVLERLQARKEGQISELSSRTLGLHFDLTVPLSRWIVQHSNDVVFPFRRYQIQKVWRGERPQEGRFREFRQADVDIVGNGELGFHHEVEVATVMLEALNALPIPRARMRVNNRKILQGACEVLGIVSVESVLRELDKLDKEAAATIWNNLAETGLTPTQVEGLQKLTEIVTDSPTELRQKIQATGLSSELLSQGTDELCALLEGVNQAVPGQVQAYLSLTRGLDYYTGSVYETFIQNFEHLGSICSGGRYDALARNGSRFYPGVGMSIGVSRLVSLVLSEPFARSSRATPSAVYVAVDSEETRGESNRVARELRQRGIPCEVSAKAAKYGKQIRAAEQRGIPFVWFPATSEVKDIRSGVQQAADATKWCPPESDWWPTVETSTS